MKLAFPNLAYRDTYYKVYKVPFLDLLLITTADVLEKVFKAKANNSDAFKTVNRVSLRTGLDSQTNAQLK